MASFLAISRLGNFHLAARELGLSQGAISQQLQKLEAQLGVRLIDRDRQGCRLTHDGREFEGHAQHLHRLAANAVNAFRRRPLMLGASSNIGIYLLRPYLRAYGEVLQESSAMEIRIHRNPVIAEKLASGDIDLALMEWWDQRPGYSATLWRKEQLVVIVGPDHPWAGLPSLAPKRLRGVPLLGGEPGTGTGRILMEYLGEDPSMLPAGRRLGSTDAVKQWVKDGMGVSVVLAGTVADEVRAGNLVAIPFEGDPPCKSLYVIWRDTFAAHHPARRFAHWLAATSNSAQADSR